MADDFNKWLSEPPERTFSIKCQTCAYGPKLIRVIQQFMAARANCSTKKTCREFWEYLKDPKNGFNYHLGDTTLNTHMRRCEPKLYKSMRLTDIKLGAARGISSIDHELRPIVQKQLESNTITTNKTTTNKTTLKRKGK